MTTQQTHGQIIYYDQNGGAISRTVTADDVEAMEAELDALRAIRNAAQEYKAQWLGGHKDAAFRRFQLRERLFEVLQ